MKIFISKIISAGPESVFWMEVNGQRTIHSDKSIEKLRSLRNEFIEKYKDEDVTIR